MEDNKLIDLDKKVEELKSIIERKSIIDTNENLSKEIEEIAHYDIVGSLEKNKKLIDKIRIFYIVFFLITISFFIYNLFNPFTKIKEIKVYVERTSSGILEANDPLLKELKEKIELSNNELEAKTKELELLKKEIYLKVLENKSLNIDNEKIIVEKNLTTNQQNIVNNQNISSINNSNSGIINQQNQVVNQITDEQKIIIQQQEDLLVKKSTCSGDANISLNINIRELPGIESNRLAILSKGEKVTVLNCGVDINGEQWYKVKTSNNIEGWISFIGIRDYVIHN